MSVTARVLVDQMAYECEVFIETLIDELPYEKLEVLGIILREICIQLFGLDRKKLILYEQEMLKI